MMAPQTDLMKAKCQNAAVTCIGKRARSVARVVAAHYDTCLKPTGLKGTQFTLLNAVCLNPFISIGWLAEQLVMDRTTLNRNLKPLERQKLMRTEPGEDRRLRTLVLTRKGEKVLQKALPLWKIAQVGVEKLMGGRRQHLIHDLRKLESLKS